MLIDFEYIHYKHELNIRGLIHVGSFIGEEYPTYFRFGVNNLIFFEPQPNIFSILKDNVGFSTVVNKAVGNENKKVEFNVSHTPGGVGNGSGASSSVLKPKKHLEQYPHITFNETIEVDMIRLDDYWKDSGLPQQGFNFLNIDVQGFELEVLRGAAETLNYVDYILTEVNREELYEDCVLVEELDEFLDVYGFVREETSWGGGSWGDAFYVKND
tara:strand:- start:202 stop:843 length:642 start_codon:yes stop_codon:yes gene_type:complete